MSLDRAFLIAFVVAGAVGGAALAFGGAFFIPMAYGPLSVGDAVALLSVGPFCHVVGRAARSSLVGAVPGVAWLVATMFLGSTKTEGDLVVTNEPFGFAFMLLGAVSAAVGIGTIRTGIERDLARAVRPNGSSEPENGR